VNGREAGLHRGGYDPFTFDISALLTDERQQELVVAVWDPTDAGTQPRGKQVREPGGIFYTSVTGIWGTVWLEPVPEAAITDFTAVPDIGGEQVTITVAAEGTRDEDRAEVVFHVDGSRVAIASGEIGSAIVTPVANPRLWSPDDPFLYDMEIRLVRDGEVIDEVRSYVGMREISVGQDENGVTRLLLNNHYVFQSGTLDQGYWPDGLYTAPTEEAMVYDLEMLEAMGFNMLRKHVKVEPRTFYSWCDRMGILVWQDMPNANIPLSERGSDVATDPEATGQFRTELVRLIDTHRNHPSIVMWVPFNEGWGQHDSERIVQLVRATDPTRPVNHASGWHERGLGDVVDRHSYPAPNPPQPDAGRAAVQGEFGGLGFNFSGHTWTEGWGYDLFTDREDLTQRFEDFFAIIRTAAEERGLSASVYTQTTDIESENNGLLTYDREVAKIEPQAVALAQRGYLAPRLKRRAPIFIERTTVQLHSLTPAAHIHYTVDGSEPTQTSPVYAEALAIDSSTTLKTRAYWEDGTSSRVATYKFEKVVPRPAVSVPGARSGLSLDYYEQDGSWRNLPDFDALEPAARRTVERVQHSVVDREEYFGLRFRGYVQIPQTGVYGFYLTSDDGSRLLLDGELAIDNDGIHGAREKTGYVALEAGLHPVELLFFQGAGGIALSLSVDGPGLERQEIPPTMLFHE
ncbi:MAG: chitobiase/beta-hexosaminidase C-terminal domain-containing protein, partial [Gemmatimonadota bacterium]